ncbi:MAG: 2-succinylbenzoate--CoA ligase [Calothrix sp. MO_167.B42]|nr:2-succinylbenzoate--CoA ligase [Calothrix sp. MO_167.B42]
MATPLEHLKYISNEHWLIGIDSQELQQLATEFYLELTPYLQESNPPKIILAQPNPVKFLAGFIAACTAKFPIFICNHSWGKQEWQQVLELVQPDIIWAPENIIFSQIITWQNTAMASQKSIPNRIMIPTGGSSGQIKFAIHTWDTLMASVQGFTTYFNLYQVNSFCVLPLYHVSGLMQFMRSFLTSGKLAIAPFKELEYSQIYNLDITDFCLSLVPTQLQKLLQQPTLINWLSQFYMVLLGGAPAWHELLAAARHHKIRLAPTYGMTETASQISTLKPDDFLQGKINAGQILPHANVTICNELGQKLAKNQVGNIYIQAKSLFLGYYQNDSQLPITNYQFKIDDLGFFDDQGYLHIVGRNSDKIITGGENVYPVEIEAVIRATGLIVDICVIGIPDEYWGQAVTAIYVPQKNLDSHQKIIQLLKDKISRYKIPKHWIVVENIFRNEKGKINRQELKKIAMNSLKISAKHTLNKFS